MALEYSKIVVCQFEVDLKNKPEKMLRASAKGTVPVLVLEDGVVIDQSMDIMRWALTHFDPDGWLNARLDDAGKSLIHTNDVEFKPILDQYKYSQNDQAIYRNKAKFYLEQLNLQLMNHRYLLANEISIADIAIFPFIRQFCMVDKPWFEDCEYQHLKQWLYGFLNSDLFHAVMMKRA